MENEQEELEETQINEDQMAEPEFVEEEQNTTEAETEHKEEKTEKKQKIENQENSSSFIHGLSVGLGMGCITAFIITWIAVFFSPMLPSAITYESMLSIFIYPMLYMLALGLVALTAGVVREYYTRK
ncbi:hypothetical protein KEJ45_04920 [Candidatus Bathyarchaeota archaeon]|nr:hypothetical protein [Candidatus Bathyarchaeota archaeon]